MVTEDPFIREALDRIAEHDPERAVDLADRLDREERRDRKAPARARFATRLRELIEYRGLKQREVADLLGLGEHGNDRISRYVTADRPNGRMPEYPDLVNLAAALGVSTGYFLDPHPAELEQLHAGELPDLPADR